MQTAFIILKKALVTALVLVESNYSKTFMISTAASIIAIGAI